MYNKGFKYPRITFLNYNKFVIFRINIYFCQNLNVKSPLKKLCLDFWVHVLDTDEESHITF